MKLLPGYVVHFAVMFNRMSRVLCVRTAIVRSSLDVCLVLDGLIHACSFKNVKISRYISDRKRLRLALW